MLRSLRLVATNQVSFIRRFERGVGRLTKMAEVKTTQEKTENKRENVPRNKQTCNNPTFNTFDIFCVLFSLGTFVADLSTGKCTIVIVFVLCLTGVFPTTLTCSYGFIFINFNLYYAILLSLVIVIVLFLLYLHVFFICKCIYLWKRIQLYH